MADADRSRSDSAGSADGGRAQGRPVPAAGCHLGSRIVTSLVARCRSCPSEAEAPLDTGPHLGVPGWTFAGLRGANWGANGDRHRATPGHVQPVSVQLNSLSGHTQRLLTTVQVCLLSSGSRVRILPGAQCVVSRHRSRVSRVKVRIFGSGLGSRGLGRG